MLWLGSVLVTIYSLTSASAHDAPLPIWTELVPATGLRLKPSEGYSRPTKKHASENHTFSNTHSPRFQPVVPSHHSPMSFAGPHPAKLTIQRPYPTRVMALSFGPQTLLTECGGFGIAYTIGNLEINDQDCQSSVRHGSPQKGICEIFIGGQAVVKPLQPTHANSSQVNLNQSRLLSDRIMSQGLLSLSDDDFRVLPLLDCSPVEVEITLVYDPQ